MKSYVHVQDRGYSPLQPVKNALRYFTNQWTGTDWYSRIMMTWVMVFTGWFGFVGFNLTENPVLSVVFVATGSLIGALVGVVLWFAILSVSFVVLATVGQVVILLLQPLGCNHPMNITLKHSLVRLTFVWAG